VRRGGARIGLVLVALAWGSLTAAPGPSARVETVAHLTDPALLERICRKDGSPRVRAAALARLTDPAVLAFLARTHPDWRIRKAAAAAWATVPPWPPSPTGIPMPTCARPPGAGSTRRGRRRARLRSGSGPSWRIPP
jgi:hypothetical protein